MPSMISPESNRRTAPIATAALVAAVLTGSAVGLHRTVQGESVDTAIAQPSLSATVSPAGEPSPEVTSDFDAFRAQERLSRNGERTAEPGGAASGATVTEAGSCEVSFYWEPQPTASGEVFDPEAMTAAHKSLPFGTRVRVTNPDNGASVVVRINDRGPYIDGRCIDLSRGAFRVIADLEQGVLPSASYEVLAD